MKKIIMILALTTTIFFTACSGGGSSSGNDSTTPPPASTSVAMIPNQIYTMHSGQSIKKDSTPTEVLVETDTSTGVTTATLKSGSASIITND